MGLVVLANNDPVQLNARSGRPLKIADKQYSRGLYCHAVSKVVVRLPGPGKSFSAIAGVDSNDQTSGGRGSVVFSVNVERQGRRSARAHARRHGGCRGRMCRWMALRSLPWRWAMAATASRATSRTGRTRRSCWPMGGNSGWATCRCSARRASRIRRSRRSRSSTAGSPHRSSWANGSWSASRRSWTTSENSTRLTWTDPQKRFARALCRRAIPRLSHRRVDDVFQEHRHGRLAHDREYPGD